MDAGLPKIRMFLARLKSLAWDELTSHGTPPVKFLSLPDLFGHDAGILMKLAILNAIGCLFVAGAFRYHCLATLLISYGLFVVLGVYLFKTARLPERVSYNIPLFVSAICLYWAAGFRKRPVAANQPNRLKVSLAPFWRAGIL